MRWVSLILCAGSSSRMGRAKALLPWAGTSLLGHAVATARGAGLKNVIVVLGGHAEEIWPEAQAQGVEIHVNADWGKGMGSSLKTGIRRIQTLYPGADGALIQLVDQPLVTVQNLQDILGRASCNPAQIVAAEYAKTRGAPALFPKIFFKALLEIGDGAGAKKFIDKYHDHVVGLPVAGAAHDIDTPQDLLRTDLTDSLTN